MTSNKPPRQPHEPPSLGAYRPSNETDPRAAARPGPPPHAAQPPPGRPMPPPGYAPQGRRMPPPPPASRYRAGPPDDDGSGGGILKFIGFALLTIVVLAVAGITALYLAGPADLVRDQIVARVKQETGRDLVINGDTSFTFYPSLGVSMSDASLSAPPDMKAPPLVTIKNLTASVALMPLLQREVEVQEVRLEEPVVNLQVDANGRKSWDFAAAIAPAQPVRYAQAAAPGVASDATPASPAPAIALPPNIEKLTIGDIRIIRGTVHYTDPRTATMETVSAIDLTIAAPTLDSTATANGTFNYRNEPLELTSAITSPAQFMRDQSGRLVAHLKGGPLDVRYDGTARFGAALDLDGNLALSSPSLHRLTAFAQNQKPAAAPDRPLAVTGKLSAANNTWTLSGATGAIDRTKGTGDIAVTTGAARPIVRANLKFAELDLNAILGLTPTGQSIPATAPAPAAKPATPETPQSIEDLLKENPPTPGTQVRGFAQRSGWSQEPYNFTALNLIDADARVSVGRLLYKEIKIGQSLIAASLKAGVLKVEFTDVQLYGGRGKGLVAIDASDLANPRITTNIALDGVQGLPLLKDAADLDWLSGKAKITAGVTGQGKNQAAIMNSLGGSADIAIADGAIVGINIPGLLRNVGQGKLGGLSSSPTEKTDFSEMSSSWAINNGVARNSDLKLVGPLIRVTGAGAVKLGERTIDYTLKPKIVADARGQGGAIDIGGLEVPLKVQGPWEKPKFAPDLGGVLKDPDKAVEAIKEIGKQFKGKDAKEVLRGLFGGGGAQ